MDISTTLIEHENHAAKIDELTIANDYEGLKVYLEQFEDINFPDEEPESACMFYYLGTGYGTLATHYQRDTLTIKDAMEYRKRSFSYLRKAIELFEIHGNNLVLLLRAYTNYANELSYCNRTIEAIRLYRKALSISPDFTMAMCNYGVVLQTYANTVNDFGHRNTLYFYAYHAITKGLKNPDDSITEEAQQSFEDTLDEYNNLENKSILSRPTIYKKRFLGEYKERQYRLWCLKHHLFLNPLNDLIEQNSTYAHDPLVITRYTENPSIDGYNSDQELTPPKWFSMLNQLKEEYICARYLCFEGCKKTRKPHYADKGVRLTLSNYDYVNYSIRLEQLKSSFRSLFSIFDQVAFVINEFWQLGLLERKANAHNVFIECEHYPDNNEALTALYWSYLEFHESFGISESASERNLKILRNALEHKFVKIHEFPQQYKIEIDTDRFYHISEADLIKYTLRLLELSREFIMELVYAISLEERKKVHDEETIFSLNIGDYDDKWKI